jgi:hypothetical protein
MLRHFPIPKLLRRKKATSESPSQIIGMNKQQAFTAYNTMVPHPVSPPSTTALASAPLGATQQLVGSGAKQLFRLASSGNHDDGPSGGTTTASSTCPTMVPDAIAASMASANYNTIKTIKMNAEKGEFWHAADC